MFIHEISPLQQSILKSIYWISVNLLLFSFTVIECQRPLWWPNVLKNTCVPTDGGNLVFVLRSSWDFFSSAWRSVWRLTCFAWISSRSAGGEGTLGRIHWLKIFQLAALLQSVVLAHLKAKWAKVEEKTTTLRFHWVAMILLQSVVFAHAGKSCMPSRGQP